MRKGVNVALGRNSTYIPFQPPPSKEHLTRCGILLKQGENIMGKKSFFRYHSLLTDSDQPFNRAAGLVAKRLSFSVAQKPEASTENQTNSNS